MTCTITLVLIGVAAVLVGIWYNSRKKALNVLKKLGIPGPEPSSLLFGNIGELGIVSLKDSHVKIDVLTQWYRTYGKVFGYYRGPTPVIQIGDMEMLKQIFIKEFAIFTNRPEARKDIGNLLFLSDQRWKEVRRVLTPTFSAQKLKKMINTIDSCATTLHEVIEDKMKKGGHLEVLDTMRNMSLDVIFKCVLALDMECQKKQNSFVEAVKKVFNFTIDIVVLFIFAFPGITTILIPLFKFTPQDKIFDTIVHNIRQVMNERRSGEQEGVFQDVLQLLIEASEGKHEEEQLKMEHQLKESGKSEDGWSELLTNSSESLMTGDSSNKKKALLTDDEIIANCISFLLAGFETTAHALCYALYNLAKHQDIQDQLREEVLNIVPENEKVKYDHLHKLQYLEQVLCESMRIYPPVVSFISRVCKETTKIYGWTIPKNAVVEAPIYLLHHDPDYWPEPETFDPDRFNPENRSEENRLAYCPFGIGPRKCIGERFALMEIKLCLATLVKKFKILPSETKFEDPLKLKIPSFSLFPINGVWVKFIPR